MNQKAFLEQLRPYFARLLERQLQAYSDFDKCHPPDIRVTVEPARPKWVNARTLYLLELEFGVSGPVRVVRENDLGYLLIEGGEFNIGLRVKKLDRDWRSSNHPSGQQDALRQFGFFFWEELRTYHLILGYRDSGGLEPSITDIAVTWEHDRRVEVLGLLWTAQQTKPINFIQENLPLPPPPKLRRKPKPGEGSDQQQSG